LRQQFYLDMVYLIKKLSESNIFYLNFFSIYISDTFVTSFICNKKIVLSGDFVICDLTIESERSAVTIVFDNGQGQVEFLSLLVFFSKLK